MSKNDDRVVNTCIYGVGPLIGAVVLYSASILGVQVYAERNQPVLNRAQLEHVLKEEKKKLGLMEKEIDILLVDRSIGMAPKLKENKYAIILGKSVATKSAVKHEIYHIAKGHCEYEASTAEYFFLQEPGAAVYSAFDYDITGRKK